VLKTQEAVLSVVLPAANFSQKCWQQGLLLGLLT